MSLTVRNLNADSSFLLTFHPSPAFPSSPGSVPGPGSGSGSGSGSFSVLLDPWLFGSCEIFHRKFSAVRHTLPSSISSLVDVPTPDLVVVSQNKPDHCHEGTLRQLPGAGTKTLVLAHPRAAKNIRSWRHFEPGKVQALKRYDRRRQTVRRFPVPPPAASGHPGEVTVAYLPARRDLTGLHMAIGITYRPPTSSPALPDTVPTSPPFSPLSFQTSSSASTLSDRTISVIYAPHGAAYPMVRDYASSHLVAEAALPLTALLHSFDRVQNPWWLGGNVSSGMPGGMQIARSLMARCWISAHDEEKEVRGLTSIPVRTRKHTPDEVRRAVAGAMGKRGAEVVVLGMDEDLSLSA
ncbi:MAG: hypothetical protein M1832_002393 [Thelocarpon impressellum]|nr:MAG: hypothetical protein M1832_002393 [Thelocarpon impressellum]